MIVVFEYKVSSPVSLVAIVVQCKDLLACLAHISFFLPTGELLQHVRVTLHARVEQEQVALPQSR